MVKRTQKKYTRRNNILKKKNKVHNKSIKKKKIMKKKKTNRYLKKIKRGGGIASSAEAEVEADEPQQKGIRKYGQTLPKVEEHDLEFIEECQEYYKHFINLADKHTKEYEKKIQWVEDNHPEAFRDVDLNLVKYILSQEVYFSSEEEAAAFALLKKAPIFFVKATQRPSKAWEPDTSEIRDEWKIRRLKSLWSTNDEEARFRAVALCLLLQTRPDLKHGPEYVPGTSFYSRNL